MAEKFNPAPHDKHAAVLGFRHPITGEVLRFESALPGDLAQLRQALLGLA